MDYSLDFTLGLLGLGLRSIGIWPVNSRFVNLKFFHSSMIIFATTMGWFFNMYLANNAEYLIETVMYSVVFSLTFLKLTMCKLAQNKIGMLLKCIDGDCKEYFFLSSGTKKRIVNNIRWRKNITIILLIGLQMSMIAYIAQTYDTETHKLNLGLMMPRTDFFQNQLLDSPLFYVVSGFAVYSWFVTSAVVVSIDSIYATCLIHATDQLIIVSEKLKKYNKQRFEYCIAHKTSLQYCNCLKCIVQHHIKILRFIKDVEDAFSAVISIELIRTVIHLGIQIHNLIWFYNINHVLKLAHVLMMLLSINCHLLLYCLPAKYMTEAGYRVGLHAYKMNWYNFGPDKVKSILLIILRAQVPCYVTAAKFVRLSLETYTSVVSTSASYATVIVAVRK